MPWNTASIVQQRAQFALAALRASLPFSLLCARFGVSRKTGYKWLARFRSGGVAALGDRSRQPHRRVPRLLVRWEAALERLHRARPHWGARKLWQRLRALHPRVRLPCVRTIGRWLRTRGGVLPRRRRARRGPALAHPGLRHPTRVHQLWTVDFKGWLRTADGVRQEPLTVREAKSRFVLEIRLLGDQSDRAVRTVFTRLFARHGLPRAIRVDNGAPFGGKGALGLSRLSLWWLRLGIAVEFTRRARPGDNAAHEQLHRCYKAEVLSRPARDRTSLQRRSDRWRQHYNNQRPHEALGGRSPAQFYRSSARRLPRTLPSLCYPRTMSTRRVRPQGDIQWHGRLRFIGRAFAGERVGLRALSTHHWAIYLGSLLLGHLHLHDAAGMRPAHWHRLPREPLHV